MERENDLVLFQNYGNPLIAQFHKALLEDNGIPCVIKDLGFNFPVALFSQETSGIKILVRNRDLQSAFDLMSEDDDFDSDFDSDFDDMEPEEPEIDFEDDDDDDDFEEDDLRFDEKELEDNFELDNDFSDDDLFVEDDFEDDFDLDVDEEDY